MEIGSVNVNVEDGYFTFTRNGKVLAAFQKIEGRYYVVASNAPATSTPHIGEAVDRLKTILGWCGVRALTQTIYEMLGEGLSG